MLVLPPRTFSHDFLKEVERIQSISELVVYFGGIPSYVMLWGLLVCFGSTAHEAIQLSTTLHLRDRMTQTPHPAYYSA